MKPILSTPELSHHDKSFFLNRWSDDKWNFCFCQTLEEIFDLSNAECIKLHLYSKPISKYSVKIKLKYDLECLWKVNNRNSNLSTNHLDNLLKNTLALNNKYKIFYLECEIVR